MNGTVGQGNTTQGYGDAGDGMVSGLSSIQNQVSRNTTYKIIWYQFKYLLNSGLKFKNSVKTWKEIIYTENVWKVLQRRMDFRLKKINAEKIIYSLNILIAVIIFRIQ
jgi:hypothetical protein